MTYVTRAGWDARDPVSPPARIATPAPLLVLHHAAAGGFGPSAVRGHQNYHIDVRGWNDIAYTALVDDVNVYEGRGWGIRTAATGPVNDRSQAVCALGNWSTKTPPDGMLDQLASAAVLAFQAGAVDAPEYDGGHRDYMDRDCPGDKLYAKIGEINRRAALLAKNPTEDDDMPTVEEIWGAKVGKGDRRRTMAEVVVQAGIDAAIARALSERAAKGDTLTDTQLADVVAAAIATDLVDGIKVTVQAN